MIFIYVFIGNSLTKEDALSRINAQMSNEDRCKYATLIIDNNSNNEGELNIFTINCI